MSSYLFPNRRDDEQDPADYEPDFEPDEEQQLEHLKALLASPRWCATSGQRKHPLTDVREVDAVRAEVEALREALGLEESEEHEAREAEQGAYDMHADAVLGKGWNDYTPDRGPQ